MDREKLKEEFRDFVTEREDAKVNWWLNRFDQHLLTLRKKIAEMPDKYSAIDGKKVVRVEDILSLPELDIDHPKQ